MNFNWHLPSLNLRPTTDCPADQGWQNLAAEMDDKFKSAKERMSTGSNETKSYFNATVSDHTESVRRTIKVNLETKATEMIEIMMKKKEEELYRLVDENLSTMDRQLKRVKKLIPKEMEQEGMPGIVAGGQTKKLEQAVRDGSEGSICSYAIERMKYIDKREGTLEIPVGKAVNHVLPKVDALFESLDFTSTTLTNDRMRLSLLAAAGFRMLPSIPYSVSDLSIFRLDKDLLIASNCGDQMRVNELLLDGANKNVKCAQGYTPLHLAAKNGHVNVLNILLEGGADVNGEQTKGMTPLHWAAIESSPPCVASLIAAGANVDRKTENDWTALHFACIVDCKYVVELLLNAGADRSVKNSRGKTAFDLAISKRVKEIFNDTENGSFLYFSLLKVFSGL